MMKRKLVFWTAFNSYQSSKLLRDKPPGTLHPTQTEEWTDRRVALFKEFTLPSILNQEYEDFYFVVLLDPYLKHLTKPRLPRKPDPRVFYCYFDRPMLERLQESDQITLALIDGDDMYSRDAGRLMMECPGTWMYFKHGYAYDEQTQRLWNYDTVGTGPFWARRINPKEMLSFDRDKRHPTHKAVINRNPTMLPNGNFCVLLHDTNTSSSANMRNVMPIVRDVDILKMEFGHA